MESIDNKFIKKAKYQQKIDESTTQCLTCERRCKISNGKLGYCQTRINHEGTIYTIVYGCNAALSNNPIEKKPLYHFYPGSKALTIGSFGCNFDCFWCQNHQISHPERNMIEIMQSYEKYLSPEDFVKKALNEKCQGTSISFNEPTLLFEYALEVFRLAREHGLYNTYITNGYMTENVLKDLIDAGLNAMNIDIKGNSEIIKSQCGADVERIWRNAKLAKNLGIHLEITTLIIENLNSNPNIIKNISKRIKQELGEDTPFHISRFYPQYKSNSKGYYKPTSLKLLFKAFDIAKSQGLNYVYLGNVSNNKYSSTVCPSCSEIVLKRDFFTVTYKKIDKKGNCEFCGHKIAVNS